MRLPDYPIEGQPIRRAWGVMVVDYLRSITPQPSHSIRVNTGSNGTTFSINARESGEDYPLTADAMFDLVQASATQVGVRGGLWIRRRPGGTYRPALTVDGGSPSSDPANVKTLTFPASKTSEIYLDLDARSPTTLTASSGESPVFCPPSRRLILGKVVTDGDAKITSLTQWRPGGLIQDMLEADHNWLFDQTSPTGGDLVAGACYIGGNLTSITGLPSTLSGVTSTTEYYVKVDFLNATATWGSAATLPVSDADEEVYHVLTLTCSGSVISGVKQPLKTDIHALLNP